MRSTKDIAVFGFDLSGVMAQPWAEKGIECYCVDIQHPKGEVRSGNIIQVGRDIRTWLPPSGKRCVFSFFFPPCTDVAVSGARHFKDKGLDAVIKALELFQVSLRLAEWLEAPYGIENPVSTVSTYWRKPDYMFHPHDYAGYLGGEGDTYTKKTCLWVGGGFVMPDKRGRKPVQGSKIHLYPPTPDRQNLRSITPKGFARAVFEANYAATQ